MNIIIVGNGILGLTSAYRLIKKNQNIKITIVGSEKHTGCASLAAAAMFNSFCELDSDTLQNKVENEKWQLNKNATPLWPNFLKEIEYESNNKINYGFGTFLINNQATDPLEDENFDAIISGLNLYNEKHEIINPSHIPFYKPTANYRAGRAIYINNEGWVNPYELIESLKIILSKSGRVTFQNDECKSIKCYNNKINHVELLNGNIISGDIFYLAPGANFTKIIDASNLNLNFPKILYGIGCTVLLKTNDNTLNNCIRTPNRGLACGIYSAPQNTTQTIIGASNLITTVPEDGARVTSVYSLLKSSMEQINEMFYRSQLEKVNIGWRPTSQDTVPLIGKTSISNLFVATGTKRDGLHCSPLISEIISDLILNNSTNYNIELFKPERELIKIYSRDEAIKKSIRHIINANYQHDFVPAKNNMINELEKLYYNELSKLHDQIGANDWGIPPEMVSIYKSGYIK